MPEHTHSRCADELEIRNVLARIAWTSDLAEDLDDYLKWMTADVEFFFPDNPQVGLGAMNYRGKDEVRAGVESRRASGLQGPGTHTLHVISSEIVELHDDDTAHADVYWRYYVNTHATPELRSMGGYANTFRRTPEGWRLARRIITVY